MRESNAGSAPTTLARDAAADNSVSTPGGEGGEVSDCASLSLKVTQDLADIALVADQDGAFRAVFERSRLALSACPQAEPLWYAVVRAAELGFGHFPTVLGETSAATPVDAAGAAATRNPASARIKTVLARLQGSTFTARQAVALGESYAPASMALAAALISTGDTKEALALLASSRLRATPGVHTLRARALLSAGRAHEAVAEVRPDLDGGWPIAPEPFLIKAVRCDAEETLGLALLADHRAREARTHLMAAQKLGSLGAAAALRERP